SLQPTPTPSAQSAPAPPKSEAPAPAATATNASNAKDDAQARDVKKDERSAIGESPQPEGRERGRQEIELPKASAPRTRTGADTGQETSARQASRVTSPQTGNAASAPSARPSASKYDVFLPPQTEKAAPSRAGTPESPSTPQQAPRTGPAATQQVAAPRTDA